MPGDGVSRRPEEPAYSASRARSDGNPSGGQHNIPDVTTSSMNFPYLLHVLRWVVCPLALPCLYTIDIAWLIILFLFRITLEFDLGSAYTSNQGT